MKNESIKNRVSLKNRVSIKSRVSIKNKFKRYSILKFSSISLNILIEKEYYFRLKS